MTATTPSEVVQPSPRVAIPSRAAPWMRTAPWMRAVAAAFPAWVVARLLVLTTLALSRTLASFAHPRTARAVHHVGQGLNAWDGEWYLHIARDGYAHTAREGIRFFPLYP